MQATSQILAQPDNHPSPPASLYIICGACIVLFVGFVNLLLDLHPF